MTPSKSQYQRLADVAFRVNAHLPEAYQAELMTEGLRVAETVLAPRRLDDRHVLIVGGSGYIGPVVTGHLLDAGYRVRNADRFLYGTQSVLLPFLGRDGFEATQIDHCDAVAVAAVLDGITDVVILSGLVGDPITKAYPDASQAINHDGMARLIAALDGRGLNKVIFVSTCSNYGLIADGELADEDFELTPLSLYAKAKVAMEQLLLGAAGGVDYHGTALRFATAFGLAPRMRFDLTVSQFTREMHAGQDLLVYDAHTWRPYCHVRDFSEVIRRVLEAPAERVAFQVFNAGGDVNNYTKQMIVDEILTFLPDAKVAYQEHGADPRNYRVDFRRIRETLHFEPRHTVTDGIRELIAAFEAGQFADVEARPNFYGNYEIDYPVA